MSDASGAARRRRVNADRAKKANSTLLDYYDDEPQRSLSDAVLDLMVDALHLADAIDEGELDLRLLAQEAKKRHDEEAAQAEQVAEE